MATPKGNYTAYQQTSPTKLNFGEEAKNVAAAEEANQVKNEAKATKNAEAQKGIATDFNSDLGTLTDVITGNDSLDEAFARGIGKARDMMGTIYEDIKRNPRLANDTKTQLKLDNLRNYSKKLKTSTDKLTEFNTTLADGMRDGTLSAWNGKHLNTGESMYIQKNFDVEVDLNGRPHAATVELDDDGELALGADGKPILSRINLTKIVDGNGLPELVPKYDLTTNARLIGKDLGKREQKDENGNFSSYTYQTFDQAEIEARGLIKGMLGTAKSPTAVAKAIWAENMSGKAQDLDEADMKAIEDKYVDSIRPFYDELRNENIDYSARNTANKNAYDRTKDAAEAAAKKAEANVNQEVTVITDQEGVAKTTIFDLNDGMNLIGEARSLALPVDAKTKRSDMTVVGDNGNEILIDQLHLMKNGDIGYTGYEYKGKASGQVLSPSEVVSFRNKDNGKLSSTVTEKKIGGGIKKGSTVMTQIAKALNLKNEGELKTLLQDRLESFDNASKAGSKKPLTEDQQAAVNKYLTE
tara:strand:+ start:5712 stop:7289 length:1578 start_codon:yes stop_codon:yes gene_type:complete